MSDLKISQLSDGGASQATDEYVIARSGANYRIDGASVAAAATSVGTLSSLTVSGDLTVDTNTLKVDSANNRVGIGTASPVVKLDVRATAFTPANTSASALIEESTANSQGLQFYINNAGTFNSSRPAGAIGAANDLNMWYTAGAVVTANPDSANGFTAYNTSAALYRQISGGHIWYGDTGLTAGNTFTQTKRMELDASGNLGLGVTPSAWSASFKALNVFNLGALWGSSTGVFLSNNIYNDGSNKYIGNGLASRYYQLGGEHIWENAANNTSGAGAAATLGVKMTLDASGNLGVGVTPPASTVGISFKGPSGDAQYRLYNSTSGSTANDGVMLSLASDLKGYLWNYENEAFLFGTNNTERARITAGGDFIVGKTSTTIGDIGAYTDSSGRLFSTIANANNSYHVYDATNAVYRFYVGGNGTISATNTTISALSDARLKENIRDLDIGLDAILALKPRKYDWKEGKGQDKKDVRGFIAQEFEEVFPDLIDEWIDPAPEGEEPYRSVRQDLIPILVKAIQELDAKNRALEARLEALEA